MWWWNLMVKGAHTHTHRTPLKDFNCCGFCIFTTLYSGSHMRSTFFLQDDWFWTLSRVGFLIRIEWSFLIHIKNASVCCLQRCILGSLEIVYLLLFPKRQKHSTVHQLAHLLMHMYQWCWMHFILTQTLAQGFYMCKFNCDRRPTILLCYKY